MHIDGLITHESRNQDDGNQIAKAVTENKSDKEIPHAVK
jgi:hypothetical protein